MTTCPLFQLNLVVSDMSATVAFYRRLGWPIDTSDPQHASVRFPSGFQVDFDTQDFAGQWDRGYRGGSTVLDVVVESREQVDALFGELTGVGHHGRQAPYDAFWGSRFAIVEDPNGNPVGLMSPRG